MRASFFLVLLALFAVVALGQNTTTTGSGTVPPTAKPTNAPATPAPTVPGTPTTAPTVKPTGAPATPAPTVPGTPTTAPTTTPTVKPTTPANPATPAPTAAPAFANITLTATIDIVGPLSAVNVTGIEASFAAVVGVPASQVDVSFRANSRRAVLAAYTMIVNIIQRVQAGVLPATVATNIQNQIKDALANPSNPLTTTLATAGNVSVSSIATTAVVNAPTVLPTGRPTPAPAATTSGAGKLALSFASVLSFVFVFAL